MPIKAKDSPAKGYRMRISSLRPGAGWPVLPHRALIYDSGVCFPVTCSKDSSKCTQRWLSVHRYLKGEASLPKFRRWPMLVGRAGVWYSRHNDTPKEQPHLLQSDESTIKIGDQNPSQISPKSALIQESDQLSPHATFIASNLPQHVW